MSTSDMKKAREWAEWADKKLGVAESHANALAAARVIQSLPDQWIDAEKVAELADDMSNWSLPDGPSTTEIDYRHLVEIMDGFTGRINDLLTPPLPTLAELIEQGNDPEKYQWMQAKTAPTNKRFGSNGVIAAANPSWMLPGRCLFLASDGFTLEVPCEDVTPLPYLPRLEWPGSGDAPTVAEQENVAPDQVVAKDICNNEDGPQPRPEDVPAGEPWIVEWHGLKLVGARNDTNIGSSGTIWSLVHMEDSRTRWGHDSEITLVSRLVPEDKP